MSQLRVFHNHELIGTHDPRCGERLQPKQRYYRYHENNDLVVVEDGRETRYPEGTWSAADVDLLCGFMEPRSDCPNCHPSGDTE